MFKTLIVLYALSFWVTECTPNPSWSFPHLPLSMVLGLTMALVILKVTTIELAQFKQLFTICVTQCQSQ